MLSNIMISLRTCQTPAVYLLVQLVELTESGNLPVIILGIWIHSTYSVWCARTVHSECPP